ncbi:hypothetical protein [Massilia orientalis]|uniref:Uncharacterized protein n=1 Tax=Massilia orientalis TaxID=3050128 RepID=A0ACC7MJS9_9BURK|nr:hypothetical protein [Massilia sp. YIM B02787]
MADEAKYPSLYERVHLAKLMEGRVDCAVSGRWLQFPATAQEVEMGGCTQELMFVSVMTTNEDHKDRKLCELVLAREDLLHILNRMPVSR